MVSASPPPPVATCLLREKLKVAMSPNDLDWTARACTRTVLLADLPGRVLDNLQSMPLRYSDHRVHVTGGP